MLCFTYLSRNQIINRHLFLYVCFPMLVITFLLSGSIFQVFLLAQSSFPSSMQIQENQFAIDTRTTSSAATSALDSNTNASADFDLLPYINSENGIALLYPSDWIVSTSGISYPDFIAFYSPLENISDFLPPAQVVLSLTMYQENISLPEYTNLTLAQLFDLALQANQGTSLLPPERFNQTGQEPINMTLQEQHTQPAISIRSSDPITVSGYPGHRVVYLISSPQGDPVNFGVMQIWMLVDSNRLYSITYNADFDKFLKNLPDVFQILNSLRIANSTR